MNLLCDDLLVWIQLMCWGETQTKCWLCKLKTAEGLFRATKVSHLDNIVKRNIKGKKNKPQPPCFIFIADKKWVSDELTLNYYLISIIMHVNGISNELQLSGGRKHL